jgi:nucleoside-diphosphate-sugar epimerase
VQQVNTLASLPKGGLAVVIGASGVIGNALLSRLHEDDTFCRGFDVPPVSSSGRISLRGRSQTRSPRLSGRARGLCLSQ